MATVATANWTRTPSRILVASSDAHVRARVLRKMEWAGAERMEANGGAQALARLKELPCERVLLDRHLPDLDATELANFIRNEYPEMEVGWIGEQASAACDEEVATTDRSEAQDAKLVVADDTSRVAAIDASLEVTLPGMIGSSAPMRDVYRLVRLVARRDTTVLVTGETGTGKELVAEAVHALSPRSRNPFVVVNCAAIPEALLEAELFGHARGAFTGAVQSRLGRIHLAQGGTLFLDEIGELPLAMQAKLLRFLQSGEVQRLGSADVHRVDVRVVCATNAALAELVEAKQFRMDLYYRLSVFPVRLPPLRERMEDIPLLARHFLRQLAEEMGGRPKHLSDAALAVLRTRRWSGNVRELQHAMERAFILSLEEETLDPQHFPQYGEPESQISVADR
jgi:transcriptional regulator with GAF, ATPase, and Fis domain